MEFKVIDLKTGREISADRINELVKGTGLMEADIDQFYIGEDGQLILLDDCGRAAYINTEENGLAIRILGEYPDVKCFVELMHRNMMINHPEYYDENYMCPRVEFIDMFPQIWPNTAGGFSEPGMMSGQAMTTQITTVLRFKPWNANKEYYGIFFGDEIAYIVDDANIIFFEDLKNHSIRSRYEAKEVY